MIIDIECHSVEGIAECFANGINPNDHYNNEPLIYELTSEYGRTPRFKDCVKAFINAGLKFDNKILLAVLSDDAQTLATDFSCLLSSPVCYPHPYSASKAALNMFTILLAKELKNTRVKVNSADPGWTQTDLGGKDATNTVAEGARVAVWLACLDEQGPTGGFFAFQTVNPW